MNEQSFLQERIRHWEEERRRAEEGERAAMEEAERCKQLRVAADDALAHLQFSLSEIVSGGNGAIPAGEREKRSTEGAGLAAPGKLSARQRPRRGSSKRRKRRPSSVELVPELVRDERLSVGDMKRKAEAQGYKIAKQTLEYAVKKLMEREKPVLKRYQATPGSAANWVYGLATEEGS